MAQNQINTAYFQILPNTVYNPRLSNQFLINITGSSVSTPLKCVQQCFNNLLCKTATYFKQLQICALYSEAYNLGQLINVYDLEVVVITLNDRTPSGEKIDID